MAASDPGSLQVGFLHLAGDVNWRQKPSFHKSATSKFPFLNIFPQYQVFPLFKARNFGINFNCLLPVYVPSPNTIIISAQVFSSSLVQFSLSCGWIYHLSEFQPVPTTSNSLCNHFQISLPKMQPCTCQLPAQSPRCFPVAFKEKFQEKVWSPATCR